MSFALTIQCMLDVGLRLQVWTVATSWTRSQPCLHRLTKREHCFVYISPNVQTKKPNQSPRNVVTEPQGQIRFHSTDEFHILKHMRAERNSGTVGEGQERRESLPAASSIQALRGDNRCQKTTYRKRLNMLKQTGPSQMNIWLL